MIGIPYSQSDALFLNSLIPHEFGHYAFSERAVATSLAPSLNSALLSAFAGATGLTPQLGSLITNLVADWAEELFCDLFAVRIAGPAFCLAWIEILDLPNDLDQSGTAFYPLAVAEDAKFSYTHPANLYRVKQHVAELQKLGWWPEISGQNSHYIRLLSLAKDIPDPDFKIPISQFQPLEARILDALSRLMPAISREVEASAGQIETGVQEYRDLKETIDRYLASGIVPSSVIVTEGQPAKHPSPLTLLNVAYAFYLEKLDRLIDGIDGENPLSITHREKWTRKVETWAMKAIDDYLLLSEATGA